MDIELGPFSIDFFVGKARVKKTRHTQNWQLVKNTRFLSNPHETWRK